MFLLFGSALACVVGARARAPFSATHDLSDVAELRIDLPSTPITVTACNADVPEVCPQTLVYTGSWVSTGGTRSDARAHAERPSVVFERAAGFGELRAMVPTSVAGLVELELEEVIVPSDRDLDLRTTLGDVVVFGTVAAVSVDIDIGDVEIRGGDGGVGIRLNRGQVAVTTAGHVDVRSGRGSIEVVQTAGARDVYVDVDAGDVRLEVGDDANLDLTVEAGDDILVRTPSIRAVTSGNFSRRTGTASVRIEIHTGAGDVEIVAAQR
jgi:hypothetical protein